MNFPIDPRPRAARPAAPTPNDAQISRALARALFDTGLSEDRIPGAVRAGLAHISVDPENGDVVAELGGHQVRGGLATAAAALAHQFAEDEALKAFGPDPRHLLEQTLRDVLGVDPEAVSADVARISRTRDGLIEYRRGHMPPLRGGLEIVKRAAGEIAKSYEERQRGAANVKDVAGRLRAI